jgi:hypothetical protein
MKEKRDDSSIVKCMNFNCTTVLTHTYFLPYTAINHADVAAVLHPINEDFRKIESKSVDENWLAATRHDTDTITTLEGQSCDFNPTSNYPQQHPNKDGGCTSEKWANPKERKRTRTNPLHPFKKTNVEEPLRNKMQTKPCQDCNPPTHNL